MKLLGALVLLLIGLSACTSSTGSEDEPERETADVIEVPWDRYAPQVRQRVDRAIKRENCQALQDEFDAADANDERQRAKYGEGNADLLDYLDAAMAEAGCY